MNAPVYTAYGSYILSNFLSRLNNVKPSGNSRYMASCPVPAHKDNSPSLGVTLGKKGQVVFNCFAGCSKLEILHAAGFNNFSQLYPDNQQNEVHKKGSLNGADILHVDNHPQEAAEKKAVGIWQKSKPIIQQSEHTYLMKKRIQPHGVRKYHKSLVIPIHNESNQIVNLQFISPEGDKRFLTGGRKRGCFHIIGDLAQYILICEGFATGASLYEDTKQRVVIAFDVGNLLPVSRSIRELSPDSVIIICGDNDSSGIGQTKAKEAALAIGGKILIPNIEGKDWNDLITGGHTYA